MKFGIIISAALGLLFTGSCRQEGKRNLLPGLEQSDSAVVMFYHEPGSPRFFNYTKVNDRQFIRRMAEAVNAPVIKARENCVSEGKIYFHSGKEAVETIYFSRADSCPTLSFIKTGEKYMVKMPEDVRRSLDEFEKSAVNVPADTSWRKDKQP